MALEQFLYLWAQVSVALEQFLCLIWAQVSVALEQFLYLWAQVSVAFEQVSVALVSPLLRK